MCKEPCQANRRVRTYNAKECRPSREGEGRGRGRGRQRQPEKEEEKERREKGVLTVLRQQVHNITYVCGKFGSVQCLTETNVGSPETGTSQQNAVREAQAQAQPAAHPGTSDCHLVSSLPPAASSSSGNTSSEGTHVSDPTVTAVGTVVGPAAAPRQQHHVRKWNTLPHSYSMKKKKKNNNTHNPTISPSGIDCVTIE